MRTYTTPDGRNIIIDVDSDDNVTATHNGNEVGEFEFSWSEDEDQWRFMHANIIEGFQRQGIGEEMVREAIDHFGAFRLPPRHQQENDDWFVTTEGANFLDALIEKGTIPDEWVTPDDFSREESF